MSLRTLLLLQVCSLLPALGCGSGADSATASTTPGLPEVVTPKLPDKPVVEVVLPAPETTQAQKIEPVTLPDDLSGKTVQRALMPAVLGGPIPPKVVAPRARVTDLDRGDLPLPKVIVGLQPTPQPKGKPALPSPPVEHPPLNASPAAVIGASEFPQQERPLVKAPLPLNPGAADIPAMARQLPDRASVEDPTVELSAQGVINTPFPVPVNSLPFLREVIPNPFELVGQLQGKLGKETEFGTTPSVVNPEKR